MSCRILSLVLCLFLSTLVAAATPALPVAGPVDVYPLAQLKAGMKATGYSVFEGDKVEAFDVEILGVMKNFWGPRQDIILARLVGPKMATRGVAAGMSGSPVYIDGKLVGAISLRMGMFSTEPIAGITPASLMLEINEIDRSKGPGLLVAGNQKLSLPAEMRASLGLGQQSNQPGEEMFLSAIDTPLVFTGFHDQALKQFSDTFRQMGLSVMQGGAGSNLKDVRPSGDAEALKKALPPGSAVSEVLLAGDLSVAATCTVTYNDGRRVLACGHPVLNFGQVEMPMAKAEVLTVLGSTFMPFKIVNTTDAVGVMRQDRHSGIMGVLGETAPMIPVEVTIHSGKSTEAFHFQVFQNPKFTPFLLMLTCFNTLSGTNVYGEEATYKMRGSIQLDGLPDVKLENLFTTMDGAQPGPMGLAFWVGERFTRIYNNSFETPKVSNIKFDFDVLPERRLATIEQVSLDKTEARPGEVLNLKVFLRPYRGERLLKDVRVVIPVTAPRGDLRIVLSDSEVVNRPNNLLLTQNRAPGLGQLISMINREQANGRLYVTLVQQSSTGLVEDKVMPQLPSSVANVIDPNVNRQPSRLMMMNESVVLQESIPVDYVITGSQTVVVTIK